ncbi:hypothetical protein RFI_18021 [Reticulomyxa filosa]|uniref:Uncharacterized protein n=1 Tax=Reticulomyxa filosa TaxID=46433 RepID=X6N0E3_RETFI|nr:hypothetical protein RFI_18021 [Reticulomyxa filosa]|eukprot:ETO19209.1 hypothetical protein RFI_18021 [Reticulomyxa filosa]
MEHSYDIRVVCSVHCLSDTTKNKTAEDETTLTNMCQKVFIGMFWEIGNWTKKYLMAKKSEWGNWTDSDWFVNTSSLFEWEIRINTYSAAYGISDVLNNSGYETDLNLYCNYLLQHNLSNSCTSMNVAITKVDVVGVVENPGGSPNQEHVRGMLNIKHLLTIMLIALGAGKLYTYVYTYTFILFMYIYIYVHIYVRIRIFCLFVNKALFALRFVYAAIVIATRAGTTSRIKWSRHT